MLILQICDLVAISRLLNATLVIPEIQQSVSSKGIRYVCQCFRRNLYAFVLFLIFSHPFVLNLCIYVFTWAFNISFSSRFKSFSYIYDEEQFIAYLKNDVIILKTLPENLKERRRRNEIQSFKLKSSNSPNFYLEEVLPKLKKSKVIGLIISTGGGLQVFHVLKPSIYVLTAVAVLYIWLPTSRRTYRLFSFSFLPCFNISIKYFLYGSD